MSVLEEQIGQWRTYLNRRQAIHAVDVAELEDHLREQISMLTDSGLDDDEAFLVAVKRIGDLDTLSREFAREHSERLWKQLVLPTDNAGHGASAQTDGLVALGFALAAAIAIKLPGLFGIPLDLDAEGGGVFYALNMSLFVLPLLAAYFVWKRGDTEPRRLAWIVGGFVVGATVVNAYPIVDPSSTLGLTALHFPIALWLLVGIAYAGNRWSEIGGRMDFIRFSGELFIYFVLIALGGALLTGFTAMVFYAIGIDVEHFIQTWLIPCGAMGAVIVGAWLVEAKQSVVENMAPVLTRLFTPLFTLMLLAFLGALLVTGSGIDVDREVLIGFDFMLVVVLALLLYSVSARDPHAPPSLFDWVQVTLVVCALIADAVALWAISARISEFGVSPNRVAALGMNLILLVNLAWSAVLYIRFLRSQRPFAALERWQTGYLPVYAGWAAIVVVVFPPMFRFA